jgi:hypothetical protein
VLAVAEPADESGTEPLTERLAASGPESAAGAADLRATFTAASAPASTAAPAAASATGSTAAGSFTAYADDGGRYSGGHRGGRLPQVFEQ